MHGIKVLNCKGIEKSSKKILFLPILLTGAKAPVKLTVLVEN